MLVASLLLAGAGSATGRRILQHVHSERIQETLAIGVPVHPVPGVHRSQGFGAGPAEYFAAEIPEIPEIGREVRFRSRNRDLDREFSREPWN